MLYRYQYCIPWLPSNSHCMKRPHFVYSFVSWCGLLPLWAVRNNVTMNIHIYFCGDIGFHFSWRTARVFWNGCTIFCSHQQCLRGPVSPLPHQHWFLSVFFSVAFTDFYIHAVMRARCTGDVSKHATRCSGFSLGLLIAQVVPCFRGGTLPSLAKKGLILWMIQMILILVKVSICVKAYYCCI